MTTELPRRACRLRGKGQARRIGRGHIKTGAQFAADIVQSQARRPIRAESEGGAQFALGIVKIQAGRPVRRDIQRDPGLASDVGETKSNRAIGGNPHRTPYLAVTASQYELLGFQALRLPRSGLRHHEQCTTQQEQRTRKRSQPSVGTSKFSLSVLQEVKALDQLC